MITRPQFSLTSDDGATARHPCQSAAMPVRTFQLPSMPNSTRAALTPPPSGRECPAKRPGRWERAGTRAACPGPLLGGRGTLAAGRVTRTLALTCTIGLWISGCGGAPPQSATIERQYFTLRDEQGNERLTPAEELFDGPSGEDAAKLKILVLDRKTGSETWILLADLGRESPTIARYVPRARTQPQAAESPPSAQ